MQHLLSIRTRVKALAVCLLAVLALLPYIYSRYPRIHQQLSAYGREQYDADILIVGCGFSGAVLAYLHAVYLNQTSVIIEKRHHIAGNTYDFVDTNDIRVSLYGPHFFHTKQEKVWNFITKFADWMPFENRVLAVIDGRPLPVPVNIDTANRYFGLNIAHEEEMKTWLDSIQVKYPDGPKNAEEAAKARVGEELYQKIFHGYTTKQWDRDPKDLAASVTQRIPVRTNHDERYFSDPHQAEPAQGFTGFVHSILRNSKIKYFLNTDFFKFRQQMGGEEALMKRYKKVFYTGPIDAYFAASGYEKLEYRSLKFRYETEHSFTPGGYVQPAVQVNQPSLDVPYTRTCEYRWIPWHPMDPEQVERRRFSTASTIVYEYPSTDGEPYYPVPNDRNRDLFAKYQRLAEEEEKQRSVYFVGRLANYKYFNMDDAILNAINFFEKLYKMEVPVLNQDRVLVSLSSSRPNRLMDLCTVGKRIKDDGNAYWIVVDDAEQPDLHVKWLLKLLKLPLDSYAYMATPTFFSSSSSSPSPTSSTDTSALEPDTDPRVKMAMKHVEENKLSEYAKIIRLPSSKNAALRSLSQLRESDNKDKQKYYNDKEDVHDNKELEKAFCETLIAKVAERVQRQSL